MKNVDISRDSFDPGNGFSRVVWQQGRVQLDADLNEQASIMLHTLRTMMVDLTGRHGGPVAACGFRVLLTEEDLVEEVVAQDRDEVVVLLRQLERTDLIISKGRYYVDGILCENPRFLHYSQHAGGEHRGRGIEAAGCYLVYLDVWEREVTALEDQAISEVALGGADTAARLRVVWQVRTVTLRERARGFMNMNPPWPELVSGWQHRHRGALRVRAREVDSQSAAAMGEARATYRGPENQLYRVEIHQGGKAGDRPRASFKFSRDNGVVAFRVENLTDDGQTVTLREWARDDTLAVAVGQVVELVDEERLQHGGAGALPKVVWVDPTSRQIKVDAPLRKHGSREGEGLILRRWDQLPGEPRRGGLELVDGAAQIVEEEWLTLEDGIEIMFERAPTHVYRSGDYWLIAARVATGDVIWPQHDGEPAALPPHGVEHHYAPLALIEVGADGEGVKMILPLTRTFGRDAVESIPDEVFVFGGNS
ncbi:hypothetical protein F6X40_12710 [Paraburkholderia sp. UCT31]|uniref:DUF6519 domain-containing protein n=1 Tax=Paraburkholderia sp. UCT31 TaxID=2615209 RepID=UPI001654EA96|nr:DUF6519 domain-containing protein [Paraburkholderia sp. UCT31]MBC8737660.1 hypothetical protein [Paraburkholderia sp. UCT31]